MYLRKRGITIVLGLILSCLLSVILPVTGHAGFFGTDKPKEKELQAAFLMNLNGPLELTSFNAEILENLGTKVDPKWGSRFEAVLTTKEPLYIEDGQDETIKFIVVKTPKGTKVKIFGKIYSTVYQGKWNHDFDIDGNPFSDLGDFASEFEGKVIVRGSQEEKDYITAKQNAEEAFRQNLANASTILIGTWRDENSTTEFNNDGTYYVLFTSGEINKGTWHVEGDILWQDCVEFKNSANSEWRGPGTSGIKSKIVHIDQNNYVIISGNKRWTTKRLK